MNIKCLLILVIIILTTVVSCKNDGSGFENDELLGIWERSQLEGDVEYKLTITFNENLTGSTLLYRFVEGIFEREAESFEWNVKGNKLTQIYDERSTISTYFIANNQLTITEENGIITVLARFNEAE